MFLQGDAQGRSIEIGSLNVSGYTLDGSFEIMLFTRDVSLPGACVSNPPLVGANTAGVFSDGLNPDGGGTHQVSWAFPIPFVIQPETGKRTCLYAQIDGFSDVETVSIAGVWAAPN